MDRKEVVIERKSYTSILDSNLSSFRKGAGRNIAILGPRRSGKTRIVQRCLGKNWDITSVYADFSKMGMSPENFAVEFIGNFCFWFLQKPASEYKNFMGIDNLLKYASEMESARANEIIKSVQNEILKIKPDQRLLVQLAFSFPATVANDKGKKILAILDNFEGILDLNNFNQIKDVISLINFNHEAVKYVITSSAAAEIKKILRNFDFVDIGDFDRNEILEMVKRFTGKADQKLADAVFGLSGGIPFVAVSMLKHYQDYTDAKKYFAAELLSKRGVLHDYCADSLNYHLNRTSGQVLSKIILKAMAPEKELRLSEIARRIYRSAPVTKILLERLISAGIIHKKDSKFHFNDNVLKLWLKLTTQGYEFDEIDENALEEVIKLI